MCFQSEEFSRQQAIQSRCFHPLDEWIEFPRAEIDHSIVARFEKMVARYPDRLAVKLKNEQLTYAELNQAANRVAHTLVAQHGPGSEPVALLFEQGIDMIVALLGVLKAGKFYVPLSPQEPVARTRYMLADVQSTLLVTNSANHNLAQSLAGALIQIVDIEKLAAESAKINLNLPISADDFAYIIYTSGSTGQPKGVIETHRNVLHFVMDFSNYQHYVPSDHCGLTSAYTFSGTAALLFCGLLNGAALFPYELTLEGIAGLANWFGDEGITAVALVPPVFRLFAGMLEGGGHFPALRLLRVGGDRVLKHDIELYQNHFSANCLFEIGLGTSEVKLLAHYFVDHTTEIQDEIVPVGYAEEDIELLILDEAGHELGFDQIGEIAVRSRFVSPGYWRKPELTQARFLPVPGDPARSIYLTGDLGRLRPDGCLFQLGRNDAQVKIRGQLVATIEVEAVLLTLEAVQEAVVTVQNAAGDVTRLVAYIVAKQQPPPTVTHLRNQLAERLPAYMMPSIFVFLAALPLNVNHKVDRRALPPPDHSRPNLDAPYVASRTPMEATLVAIWSDVLEITPIGVYDHFLDLGGSSLQATRVITRVVQQFQIDLAQRMLLESPTIAAMAMAITHKQAQQIDAQVLEKILNEVEATDLGE